MSAPSDRLHDPNSVSFYAGKGQRAVRLAQVSEAAAALIPEKSWDDHVSSALADVYEEDSAGRRLEARRSLDPERFPEPQMSCRGRSWLASTVRFVLVIAAALVAGLIAVGHFPFREMLGQQASRGPIELASSSTRQAPPIAAERAEPVVSELVVQNLHGTKGEPGPLGAALQARAEEGAVIMITGLVPGMTLSTGAAVGTDGWQVPVTELGNTWVVPSKDFVGPADLVAELRMGDDAIAQRQRIHLEWTGPESAVAPPRRLDREEVAALLKRGKDFIAAGDFAAARLLLQFAAEANDAEAALALAATYDPMVLRERRVYGMAGDIEQARAWYEKAKQFGSPDASRRLGLLASGAR
jgi:hypothetical protein